MRPRVWNTGRKSIALFVNGSYIEKTIASLLLETFDPPRPNGMYACHGERGCSDDSLDNIYWASPRQNAIDRIRDGANTPGESNGNSKCSEMQVRIIRRFYEMDAQRHGKMIYMENIFGLSRTNIYDIVHRRIWRHI
jgi:hypothetical protein